MADPKLDVTLDDVAVLATDLSEADTEDKRLKAVASFLDAITPAKVLIPIPLLGDAAEAFDGVFYERALLWLRDVIKGDPEKKAARKAKRAAKAKAKRAERRPKRRRKNQSAD